MSNSVLKEHKIDHVEIYTPMAKALAYWHEHALGFSLIAQSDNNLAQNNLSSFVLKSNNITLVITSYYPTLDGTNQTNEINSFINKNYCGVKSFALEVEDVKAVFEASLKNGAIPAKFPITIEDENGCIEEAAIRLYDDREVIFINRKAYKGIFKPGYISSSRETKIEESPFLEIDHIAAELRINEINYWTNYINKNIGTSLIQSIERGAENTTGMVLNISQSLDKNLTLVMAEPDAYQKKSKIQQNIDKFGPGIHHLAFSTADMVETIKQLKSKQIDFVSFPPSYYNLLRENPEFKSFDIDALQENGILIDKEDNSYLLQKFIKPISDRPFFFYEIVQRVNGYNGFALKNINVLKKAEEIQIMKATLEEA